MPLWLKGKSDLCTNRFLLPKNVFIKCYHCGDDCGKDPVMFDDKPFCCTGCRTVYEILSQGEACEYYNISEFPGVKSIAAEIGNKYAYLDMEEIRRQLLDFSDGGISKVKFYIPSIHCSSCIWLLENLHRLNKGIIQSTVNFAKKQVSITFNEAELSLRQLVELLRLRAGSSVIDIGCGKAEFLLRLSTAYGVRGIGIDRSPYTIADARERLARQCPDADISLLEMDGADFRPESPHSFDLAACVGASWIFGGHAGTLDALVTMVEPDGWVIVGEPYWLKEPSEEYLRACGHTREGFGSHAANVEAGEQRGLELHLKESQRSETLPNSQKMPEMKPVMPITSTT